MLKTKDVAKLLGMPQQTLRLWMKDGTCPFGYCFKGSGKRHIYYIDENQLDEFLQKEKVASDKATK